MHAAHCLLLLTLAPLGCQSLADPSTPLPARVDYPTSADLAISQPPYEQVQADWKQRIDQPYVYIEAHGSYTGIGKLLERACALARETGVEVTGPPFALYYDDPGRVAVDALRMRACLPVDSVVASSASLRFDVLPSTTVVYAFVAGPYPDVPRAYPGLYAFLRRLNWVEDGPLREIYLRNPASVADFAELVTEVQIPATLAR